jgi:hypothetical protein
LILPDGSESTLSFRSLWGIPETIQVKTMEPIGFDASFRFPVDDVLREYLHTLGRDQQSSRESNVDTLFKTLLGRRDAPQETALNMMFEMLFGERYFRCSFTAVSRSESKLFLKSRAIHNRFFQLLARHEGIIGLLDVEENRWFLLPALNECIEVRKSDIDRAYAASEIVPTQMDIGTAYVPHLVLDVDGWLELLLSLEIRPTTPPEAYLDSLEIRYNESYGGLGPSFRQVLEWIEALDAPPESRLDAEARAKYEGGLDSIGGALVRACGDYSNFEGPYRRHLMAGLGSLLSSQCRAYYYAGVAYLMLAASRTGPNTYNPEALTEAQNFLDQARRIAPDRIEIEAIQLFLDLACQKYGKDMRQLEAFGLTASDHSRAHLAEPDYARHVKALGQAANDHFRVQLAKLDYAVENQRDQAYEQYERTLALASNDDQRLAAHFAILAKPEGILRRSTLKRDRGLWVASEEMLTRQMSEPEILEQIMAIVGELPDYKARHEKVSRLLKAQVPVTG